MLKKLTKKNLKKMQVLRNKGLSYKKIGEQFNISYSTAYYHLCEAEKERVKNKMREWGRENKDKVKKKNERFKDYSKDYMRNRYNNDEEFRKRIIQNTKNSFNRRHKIWVEKGLCVRCGRKREDKKFKICLRCREMRRK